MLDIHFFEAKNSVYEFDYQEMNMYECVRCPQKWCSTLFNEWFSNSGLWCSMSICLKQKIRYWSSITIRWTSLSLFDVRVLFDVGKMVFIPSLANACQKEFCHDAHEQYSISVGSTLSGCCRNLHNIGRCP